MNLRLLPLLAALAAEHSIQCVTLFADRSVSPLDKVPPFHSDLDDFVRARFQIS